MNTVVGRGTAASQHGFTLLEAMVALVVLSVGLLGIAGMQVSSLKASTGAHFRSIAAIKASELADRMRANLPGVDANKYVVSAASSCVSAPAVLCASGGGTTAATCTPVQMATFDLYEISCVGGVTDLLPGGDLEIECTDDADLTGADGDSCTDGSSHTVTITWQTNVDKKEGLDAPEWITEQMTMTVIPGTGD